MTLFLEFRNLRSDQINMRIFFLSIGLITLLHGAFVSGEEFCGDAKVVSGTTCSNLVVFFQLKECGGPETERAKVLCEKEGPKAVLRKENGTFFIPLREISPGVWTLVGSLRKYPKDWNPGTKSASPIIVLKTPTEKDMVSEASILEVGGQFRFRIEENQKRDFQSVTGFSSLRMRTTFQFRPHPNVDFLVMPQASHVLGEPQLSPSTSAANGFEGLSGVSRDPRLSFHQAFGQLKVGKSGKVVLGRQIFSYGEEVLVGASDWENPGRSFDGIRFRFENEALWWDLFTTKLWDSNSQNSGKGDKDFHGAYFSWNHPESGLRLEPYVFFLRDHLSSLRESYTAGFFSSFLLAGLEVKTEASGQWGARVGQQVWGELGSSEVFGNKLRISADGFWASEDFNPLFPSLHHLLGWADVLGRRNLAGLGLTIGWSGLEGLELQMRGLHFLRVNTEAPPYASDGSTSLSFSSNRAQDLGSELDLRAEISLFSSTRLQSGAAIFLR